MVGKNLLLYLHSLETFKKRDSTVLSDNVLFILNQELHLLELQKLLINDGKQLTNGQEGIEFSKILRKYISKKG